MESIRPFLMFQGEAEAAMNFYASLFPDSRITDIQRYGPGSPANNGSVMRATLSIAGQSVMCIDSPVKHAFTFTPAFSFFIECSSEDELGRLLEALSERGGVLMPRGNYGFSKQFAWVNDRFGVSWQLNLA
jgi:predicted 3-demethylubiquinone-9 3-methyltransferase (glyoxalase superfamily)